MDTDMKVEVIYREKIKPSSPTSHHLSTFKLCLIDQLAPVMYIPIILFYPFSSGLPNDLESIAHKANHLKKTLQFIGAEPESKEASKGPLLVVQVTFFECGGMSIGISISHKIADASTLHTFLNSWVATTLGSREAVLPEFKAASLLPPSEPPALNKIPGQCRTRRFVFNPEKMAALRCKSASETVKTQLESKQYVRSFGNP
ncbi:hypothetical protein FNV43_RR01223 [Rhamnella rubrinervis]|uniref:Uncharacterized protein n=1 Tax=Rhamnella rubrinervis TaxID=2594499 RepID=A0A8K0HS64_9ROSA|nr:hypothetical protein FNV43_RR01223 [Rhamnella rubrinervis]